MQERRLGARRGTHCWVQAGALHEPVTEALRPRKQQVAAAPEKSQPH